MFGDEIAYLTGADRGFIMKNMFTVRYKDYESERTDTGKFLHVNGYSKYRDFATEYASKNEQIIDIKNPTRDINGISYTNYLDKGFEDKELQEIALAAHRRAKKIVLENKVLLQQIGNATDLEAIPLVAANYKIPFNTAIDMIFDNVFQDEWNKALVEKGYVNVVGEAKGKGASKLTTEQVISGLLKGISAKAGTERKKPSKASIPEEYLDIE
jgi:hypothetical protein